MLPFLPNQQLSQNKIAGMNIAWGRAKWQSIDGADSEGYVFPEGSFQLAQSLAHLEGELGLSMAVLMDCIEQFEDQLGDPENTQQSLGLLKNFGELNPGLVVRSRIDDRVLCVMTPASWEKDQTDAYFQWYFDDQNNNMLATFDELSGVAHIRDQEVPAEVPSYEEAYQRMHQLDAVTESRKQIFLQKVWDYHKNLAPGYRVEAKKKLLGEWSAYKAVKKKRTSDLP